MQAKATGYWNVIVERDGAYELEFWPIEANLPLASGIGNDGKDGAVQSPRPCADRRR